MAMHGDVLLDADRIAKTLTAMVATGELDPMTPAEIQAEAATVADFMQTQGDFYDNPLWTLNAFAFSGEGETDPFIAALPDKLIMGDGIIDAYDAIGLGDVGIRVIMAHEFGHHVQFELGVFDTGPTDPAEATRRTELMADAMAAYYGTHKKGLALNKKRVADALLELLHRRRLPVRQPRPPRNAAAARACCRLGRRPGRRCQAAQLHPPPGDLRRALRRSAAADHLRELSQNGSDRLQHRPGSRRAGAVSACGEPAAASFRSSTNRWVTGPGAASAGSAALRRVPRPTDTPPAPGRRPTGLSRRTRAVPRGVTGNTPGFGSSSPGSNPGGGATIARRSA